jgi:hypothetical protein
MLAAAPRVPLPAASSEFAQGLRKLRKKLSRKLSRKLLRKLLRIPDPKTILRRSPSAPKASKFS